MPSRAKKLLLIGLITLPLAGFTFGGWAVTTVEDLPEFAVAGRAFDLTWTVRQHGREPLRNLSGSVLLTSGSRSQSVRAVAIGEGRYRAQVKVAQAGRWKVKIDDGFTSYGGHLAPLTVIAATAPAPAPMSAYDRGEQLYYAKGCATCHSHQLTKAVPSTKDGPDLSEPKFAAPYLARFLTDPSIKKDWKGDNRMPNLRLKPAEIAALTAFLNQEKRTASR